MIAFGCVVLNGCVLFVPGVDDLQFIEVQPVNVGTLDLHDTWGNMRPQHPPNYVIGKIEVATKSDIHAIGERADLNIWHELTICKTGALVTDWPGVYFKGIDINHNSTTEDIQALYRKRAAEHKADDRYIYEVYFDPTSIRSLSKGVGNPYAREPYNFAREPKELCLRIGGGNMIGGYFVSNTVVVPAAEIGQIFEAGRYPN